MDLKDVFDCKKAIAKQMKILKMIGVLSTTLILRTVATFLQIILRHTCPLIRGIGKTCLEGNLCALKTKKKGFARYICYTF